MKQDTACWYCVFTPAGAGVPPSWSPWTPGSFQVWIQEHVDCGEDGPAHFAAAIVVDEETLGTVVVPAEQVAFASVPPEPRV